MAFQYSQKTKPVCTNKNDASCKSSQSQFDDMNMLDAQIKSDSEYDVPPSKPADQAKSMSITQGFTTIQNVSLSLFVTLTLFIVYGIMGRVTRRS
jgi:hypothetical protein